MSFAIQIKDLQFRWKITQPLVLEIESLQVKTGESLFIRGPSGSGKTTLLNLIGGVVDPLNGSVEVLGQSYADLSAKEKDQLRGDQMGFIFQQFNLMPFLNVYENVTLPLKFSAHRRDCIEKVGALEETKRLLNHLKFKAEDILERSVTELSIGQQQRVAVARALIGRPSLIIADEPTSALDSDAREAFIQLLFKESKEAGATLVFVSHDVSLGKSFDHQLDLKAINKAYRNIDL